MSEEEGLILAIVDANGSFTDEERGEMYVAGSNINNQNTLKFVKKNPRIIKKVIVLNDCHHTESVHFCDNWINRLTKQHPEPYSHINIDKVLEEYDPTLILDAGHPLSDIEYGLKQMKNAGWTDLYFWPRHCVAHSAGAACAPEVMEILNILNAHKVTATMIYKGVLYNEDQLSGAYATYYVDNYKMETFATLVYRLLVDKKMKLIMVGQALTHCLGLTAKELAIFLGDRANQIYIPLDCTSPIPDSDLEGMLKSLRALGVNIIDSIFDLTEKDDSHI